MGDSVHPGSLHDQPVPDSLGAALEAIIAPIVRGQIRSFRTAHGDSVANGLASSLAKRIINDLTRGSNLLRLRAAVLVRESEPASEASVDTYHCARQGRDGSTLSRPPRFATHPAWGAKATEPQRVISQHGDYCWITPPGSKRPLTYRKNTLTFVGSAEGVAPQVAGESSREES